MLHLPMEIPAKLRTHEETKSMSETRHLQTGVKTSGWYGIKEYSPIFKLNNFDLTRSVPIDQMHTFDLGVCKRIFEVFMLFFCF